MAEFKKEEVLSFLSGAIHDGCLVKRTTRKAYDMQFYQKNREWLEKSVLKRLEILGIRTPIRGPYKSCYYLKFGNKLLYTELKCRVDKLPKSRKLQKLFIRGFWDAEGSCPHVEEYLAGRRKRARIPLQIGFHQNGTKALLEEIRQSLERFGIQCSRVEGPISRPVNKKPEFRFFVYSVNRIRKFMEMIKPEHPEKSKRLKLLLENVSPANRKL